MNSGACSELQFQGFGSQGAGEGDGAGAFAAQGLKSRGGEKVLLAAKTPQRANLRFSPFPVALALEAGGGLVSIVTTPHLLAPF